MYPTPYPRGGRPASAHMLSPEFRGGDKRNPNKQAARLLAGFGGLALILALTIYSCSGDDQQDSNTDITTLTTQESVPVIPPPITTNPEQIPTTTTAPAETSSTLNDFIANCVNNLEHPTEPYDRTLANLLVDAAVRSHLQQHGTTDNTVADFEHQIYLVHCRTHAEYLNED